MTKAYWEQVFSKLRTYAGLEDLPSVTLLKREGATPFKILISTMISLRTRDEVTLKASRTLFALADNPKDMAALEEDVIAQAIFPSGFYKNKAKDIQNVCKILLEQYEGAVPADQRALLEFPGVGIKTANLVLSLGFDIKAICVDTHVHRIANRMGWVDTKTPEETEKSLTVHLPDEYWIEANELLVVYGQDICTPASPHCTLCTVQEHCNKLGVLNSR